LIEAAGHTLKIELPSTPVHVHVGPSRIGQAPVNLLANAARASRSQAWAARTALVALSVWGDAATRHDGAQVFDAHLTKPASTAKVLEAVVRAREARARVQED